MVPPGPGVGGSPLPMALAAGSLGALASAAAKLSLGGGGVLAAAAEREEAEWLYIILRLGCGGMVFLLNALMWTLFAKALRYSSSAGVSVTTVASNFLSSAFLGKLLFAEVHELLWWIGITMTLCGLLLLHTVKEKKDQSNAYKKEE